MATITTFVTGAPEHQVLIGYQAYAIATLNFATTPVASGDVVQAVKIGNGCLVTNVRTVVGTAEGSTCTATVGDGSGADSWDASVNLNATAGTATAGASGTDAYVTTGKYYSADDTIDLTMGNAAAAGSFTVIVEYVRLS